jgi:two-component system phosphate regulon response regulator PhoB
MFHVEHPGVIARGAHGRVVRLLLIDGDSPFRAELTAALASAGHEVESASSGMAGLALARSSRPDVVIFDLHQPDIDGLALCRLLRAEQAPRPSLCVLTSRAEEADRVAAFEAGVDDYVTKPPSTRELILRVRSLARRRAAPAANKDAIRVGALTVDGAARRVDVAGTAVELTRREFDLLLYLAQRPGRVQSRDTLVTSIWGEIADSGRVVDTTVKRLRKKLGPSSPPIKTVRGVGYKLGID